ncbi:MAG: polyphosphate polymerase domain-containing protein [Solirubrobacterales bacterium]|nr:polyphosphate polymerase domain-containing protein [Solirubrobacterales bacterium]
MDASIDQLPGVSLEELDRRAALLRRTDVKYVIEGATFEQLIDRLSSEAQVLEIDGRRAFDYESIYFDTPSLLCFDDHVANRRPRFKARTRLYRDSDYCTFEVKLKLADGEMDKRQVDHDPDAVAKLGEAAWDCLRTALAEVELKLPETLEPSLRTAFTRVTLLPATDGQRITCDFDVRLERPGDGAAELRDGLIVVETKSEQGDSPADHLLEELGIEPAGISKYRSGISLLAPGAQDPETAETAARLFARED